MFVRMECCSRCPWTNRAILPTSERPRSRTVPNESVCRPDQTRWERSAVSKRLLATTTLAPGVNVDVGALAELRGPLADFFLEAGSSYCGADLFLHACKRRDG